ncbi:hypothetical protein GCM10007415_42290 [Parapedobacter pyrenivorans]|uniref:Uncharacterized protein n=2 Tax=Parapedobacter pyrenivorans TaxID=1305674 RepID=A0A917MEV7_9SPHI|nr:hypothetical protein GCM10007415_42290 [Parapedobacter pyrenivorans]
MYILGYLIEDPSLTDYTRDTSIHGSTYYYKIYRNKETVFSDILVPLYTNTYLNILDIKFDETREGPEFLAYINKSIETVFSSLKTGDKFDELVFDDIYNTGLNIADSCFESNGECNYLLPVDTLSAIIRNQENSNIGLDQIFKTFTSFLGEPVAYTDSDQAKEEPVHRHKITIDSLVDTIRDEQVVMFNENHFAPQCRLLVNLMLDRLYEHGFRTLALEGLADDDDRVNSTGFPVMESGFYTRDPNMANLIRVAKMTGFRIIGYEDLKGSRNRQLAMAKNIIKKTRIKKGNDVKIAVLGGFGNIGEDIDDQDRGTMGFYFKERTKIDPLTINQTKFLPRTFDDDRIEIVESSDADDNFDIYIANFLNPRRIFLGADLAYTEVDIPFKGYENRKDLGFYVYKKEEYILDRGAIPISVSYMSNQIPLKLPDGEYTCILKNTSGEVIEKQDIVVNQ